MMARTKKEFLLKVLIQRFETTLGFTKLLLLGFLLIILFALIFLLGCSLQE